MQTVGDYWRDLFEQREREAAARHSIFGKGCGMFRFKNIVARLRELAHDPKATAEAFEESLRDLEEWEAAAFAGLNTGDGLAGLPTVNRADTVPLFYADLGGGHLEQGDGGNGGGV